MLLTMFLLGAVNVVFAVVLRYMLGAPWILLAVIMASRSRVEQDLAALKAQAQLPRADMPPKQLLPASDPSTPSQ